MRSAPPRQDDVTARARIRDAAVLEFATHGFGVSLRAIAERADVSAALILHHFGSKAGLQAECDAWVLADIRERKEKVTVGGSAGDVLLALASMDETAPLVGYALRSLQAGGGIARAFVDHFAEDAEAYLRAGVAAGTVKPSADEAARARLLTLQGFGALLLDLRLHPPRDPSDLAAVLREHLGRSGLPALELYTQGLLTDRRMLDEYLLYVGDPPRSAGAAGHSPS
ncbi:TetR/AcrR family transcriptional regulator [Actinotalea solisilvae]|uniref:TetR/AcrR family transcriptional regulator n=1 Tax=Actinotalea solisilvae TaxID=2072922 RepID=UPI0018F1A1A3|nr:TetR family transcriptional regulator [Actinotalea solisilvae]